MFVNPGNENHVDVNISCVQLLAFIFGNILELF